MEISVVIPAYNEEETIGETIERVSKVLSKRRSSFEIIIVDDGSKDSTSNIVNRMKRKYDNLVLMKNEKNSGKSISLNRGFAEAQGKIIIMMDADLQQIPEDLPLLLDKMKKGYDVVNGWRRERHDPTSKLIMSRAYNTLSRFLFRHGIHDMNCGFKAIRREVIDRIVLREGFFRYIAALAKIEGFRVTEVPVRHFKREHGKSKYGFKRILDSTDLVSIKMKSMFYKRPMILFGGVGTLLVIIGILGGGYLTYLKFGLGEPLSVHLPLMFFTSISFISGLLMIMMGFLADLIKDLEYRVEKKNKFK